MLRINTNNGIVTIETDARKQSCPVDLVSAATTSTGMTLFATNTPRTEFDLSEGITINDTPVKNQLGLGTLLMRAGLIKRELIPFTNNSCNKWQYPTDWLDLYDVVAKDVPPIGYKRACSWLISNVNEVEDLRLYCSSVVLGTQIRTSDDYFGAPESHIWDITKDKYNTEGWATRWIIVYVPVGTTRYAIPQTRQASALFLPVKGLIIGQIENSSKSIFGIDGINPYDHNNEVEFLDYEDGATSAHISGYALTSMKRLRLAPMYAPLVQTTNILYGLYSCTEISLPENSIGYTAANTLNNAYSLRYLKIPATCTQFGNNGVMPALKIIDIEQGWSNTLNCSFASSYFVSIDAWVDFFNKLGNASATITIPVNTLSAMTTDQIAIATNKGWTIAGA